MTSITLDKTVAQSHLHNLPFTLKTDLANHPVFKLENLVNLAAALPRDRIEYNSGDLQPGQTAETTPKLDMSPKEVISRIENHNAWMVIKRVEQEPTYRSVLEDFLKSLFKEAGKPDQKYDDLEGYVFVSSANATTPFHVDAEENVLVQIRGDKKVHIFDNHDRTLVSEEAMEISPSKYRNQLYDPKYEDRAQVFHLSPGDGVHIPYLVPHWVQVKDNYSVSMAMTWKTPQVQRANKIRLMNGTLRHYGWAQKPPGANPAMDALKVFTHDAARMVIDPLRKSERIRALLRRMIYGKNANYYYNEPAE